MEKFSNRIRSSLYFIIPLLSLIFWSLLYLLFFYKGFRWDFKVWYDAGRQILEDPTKLYQVYGFYYTPFLPSIFSISLSLLPPLVAYFIWFFLNYIFGMLMIREFDKILKLKGVSRISYRLLFLIVISNGWSVYLQFFWNQTKFLTAFILLFILRKEIHGRDSNMEKSIKERILILFLLSIAVSISPYFIFIIFIYIFNNIEIKQIFKKSNLQTYFIFISIFLLINILFIIFPSLLVDFLNGIFKYNEYKKELKFIYTIEWLIIPNSWHNYITIGSIIFLSLITLFLILNKKLTLERRIGLFVLSYLWFSTFARFTDLALFIPFLLLLLIPYISEKDTLISFLKSNILPLVGLISVLGLAFGHYDVNDFFEYFPILNIVFLKFIVYMRYAIFLVLFSISILFLSLRNSNTFRKNIIIENEETD